MSGRGSGKTRAGACFVIDRVQQGQAKRPLLIGPTAADVRDIMVQTILDVSPPWFRPRYFPSRRCLAWPNGAMALLLSAEDPEQARGPNADLVWADELGAWSRGREMWQNVSLALRQGSTQAFVSTTPRRIETLISILGQSTTVVSRESTLANRLHLSPEFIDQIIALYQGTRFAEQQIEGLLISQPEGAWFSRFSVEKHVSPNTNFVINNPVSIACDCGTSRTTCALIYQTERIDKYRIKFNIIGDYLSVGDHYSAQNAEAILQRFAELCPGASLHAIWLDPHGSSARTTIGPSALAEYQRIFGERFVNRPAGGPVTDTLDMIEGLLDRNDLAIAPRCEALIAGLTNYSRQSVRGSWLDVPALNQSPWSDAVDALRYALSASWPEGRRPIRQFNYVPASRLYG